MGQANQPIRAQLHLTNRCNANCLFCWRYGLGQEFDELSDDRWLEIAEELLKLDIQEVTLSGGGEPLLRPQLFLQLLDRFTAMDIDCHLITNGTLISERIARRMVESHWMAVQFSVHAPREGLNDRIMGLKGDFDRVTRNIQRINREKERQGSQFPQLWLRVVMIEENLTHLPDFMDLASSLDVTGISVRLRNGTKTGTWGKDRQQQLRTSIARARDLERNSTVRLNLEFDELLTAETIPAMVTDAAVPMDELPKPKSIPGGLNEFVEGGSFARCSIPFTELVVFANGKVSPCCNFFHEQFMEGVGNGGWLEDTTTVPVDILWKEGFSSLRKSMLGGESLCNTCEVCSPDMKHHQVRWQVDGFGQASREQSLEKRMQRFRDRGKFRGGIDYGLSKLGDFPDSARLRHHLGEFHMELGSYNQATEFLEQAISLEPSIEWTRFSLGKCLFASGRFQDAREVLRENLHMTRDRKSHFHTLIFLAMTADKLSDPEEREQSILRLQDYRELWKHTIQQEIQSFSRMKHANTLGVKELEVIGGILEANENYSKVPVTQRAQAGPLGK